MYDGIVSPRAYDMSKREQAREQTRRRIVAATLELHTEHGILGTSWRDIAERADVAVATVYNHFPSLDELVPACGDLLMERFAPPGPGNASAVVGQAGSTEERIERIARELFSFYERAGAYIQVFPGERQLPAMQEWESYQRSTVESFVREALKGTRSSVRTVRLLCALFDLGTFTALRQRGLTLDDAVTEMVAAAICSLERGRSARPDTRRKR